MRSSGNHLNPQKENEPMIVLSPEELNSLAANVNRTGYTITAAHDLAGNLTGVRFLAASRLIEGHISAQVFTRAEVTLTFPGDQHLTLTGEDGRQFLALWRKMPDCPLTDEIWETLPEPIEQPRQPLYSESKNALVQYLADTYPEEFGPGGHVPTKGEEFYQTLLRLMKQPRSILERSLLHAAVSCENLAREQYSEAAAVWRGVLRESTSPDVAAVCSESMWEELKAAAKNSPGGIDVQARLKAAQLLREKGAALRGMIRSTVGTSAGEHIAPEMPEAWEL
jgi:hypothetical protein